jgi:hypothetical protein
MFILRSGHRFYLMPVELCLAAWQLRERECELVGVNSATASDLVLGEIK